MSLSLEVKVDERTEELRRSLDEVRKLKIKQDGDYYLTAQLIKPLTRNLVGKNDKLSVEFLVRQFKNFEFKILASF